MSHDENAVLAKQIEAMANDIKEIKTLLQGEISMGEASKGLLAEFRSTRSDVDDHETRITTLEEKQIESDRKENWRLGWAAGAGSVVVLAWEAVRSYFSK